MPHRLNTIFRVVTKENKMEIKKISFAIIACLIAGGVQAGDLKRIEFI